MKKRLLSIALSLMLILATLSPAMATIIYGAAISSVDDNRYIEAVAAVGSQLYLLDSTGKLTTRTTLSSEETLMGEVMTYAGFIADDDNETIVVNSLFEYNGMLYGFNIGDGSVCELVNAQGEYAPVVQDVKLDISTMSRVQEDYTEYLQQLHIFQSGGWLYYTGMDYTQQMQRQAAGRLNLTTGEHKAFEIEAIRDLAPYDDGKILVLIYDETSMYMGGSSDSDDDLAKIAVFDPESNKIVSSTTLQSEDSMDGYYTTGICYADGQVYYRDSTRIKALDMATGEVRLSAYTGDTPYGGMNVNVLYADGYYVSYGYEGITMRKLDSENINDGALVIYGEQGNDAHKIFTNNHPDIAVDIAGSGSRTSDLETIAQAMVSENQMLDVLELSVSYMPVDKLIEKGYCLDLSGYPEITSRIEKMYPQFRDALLVDGKLYGVPIDMYCNTFGVNMNRWEEIGFTKDDLPATVIELLDFVANWTYDYADEFPDVQLFEQESFKDMLFYTVLEQYILYKDAKGEALRFDTPEYRQLMEAFEQIDFSEYSTGDEAEQTIYYFEQNSLFSTYCSVGQFYNSYVEEATPMLLPIFGDDEPLIGAQLTVMAINAKTKRVDQAIAYMTSYLDNLTKRTVNITFFPDHNEPLEADYYQNNMDAFTEALENAQELLEAASDENKPFIETNIEQWENYIEEEEANRYDAAAEELAEYRANIAPYLYVQKQSPIYRGSGAASDEIGQLIQKYTDGAIKIDQMITELDNRLQMMELEEQ
ncbi:MAG: extracellular solute-binding protein [Clostridiales bacterium]|nr:extracellular solute-binding protein [Clostridiales bacterium]